MMFTAECSLKWYWRLWLAAICRLSWVWLRSMIRN